MHFVVEASFDGWFILKKFIEMKKISAVKPEAYIIPNVLKSFEVLEYVAKKPDGASFPELVQAMGINKTTLFRILQTLLKSGYLRSSPENTLYFISRNILSLAYLALDEANLPGESIDIMRAIRNELGETVMLGALADGECLLVAQEASAHQFNFLGRLGMRAPLHASAPGKAILAHLPKDEFDCAMGKFPLQKFTKSTMTDKKSLLAELDSIRRKGYSADVAEVVDGVNCVAAPIFDIRGCAVAAIWITGPASRIRQNDFPRLGAYMKSKADIISERLGFRGRA